MMEHIWIATVYDNHKSHLQKVCYNPNDERQVNTVFGSILNRADGVSMAGFKELEKATEWIYQELSKLEEGDTNG